MGNRHNWERLHPGVSHKTWGDKRVSDLRDRPFGTRTCMICHETDLCACDADWDLARDLARDLGDLG